MNTIIILMLIIPPIICSGTDVKSLKSNDQILNYLMDNIVNLISEQKLGINESKSYTDISFDQSESEPFDDMGKDYQDIESDIRSYYEDIQTAISLHSLDVLPSTTTPAFITQTLKYFSVKPTEFGSHLEKLFNLYKNVKQLIKSKSFINIPTTCSYESPDQESYLKQNPNLNRSIIIIQDKSQMYVSELPSSVDILNNPIFNSESYSRHHVIKTKVCNSDQVTFPNIQNCHKYFKCANGAILSLTCGKYLYWNCFEKLCMKATMKLCCPNDPNPSIHNYKQCRSVGLLAPDPVDCSFYFKCSSNFRVDLETCPPGQKFDFTLNQCVAKTNVSCIMQIDVSDSNNKDIISASNRQLSDNIKPYTCTRNGGRINNIHDCHKYFKCRNGLTVHRRCPFFLPYFNCWTGKCSMHGMAHCCISPMVLNENDCTNGIPIPDPDNCRNYYMCIKGKHFKKKCGNNKVFDAWEKVCKSTARCIIDVI